MSRRRRARRAARPNSKMILAGVTFGGSDAYRAWDRSTYFEFEADPSRSSGFSVSRVVDHPFKSVDPDKYRDDPDQVILTFENIRSNLTVTCVTCKEVPLLEKTNDRHDISPEFRSVGLKKLPDALLNREGLMLSSTNTVWLPPRRRHAAPHLLVDSAGKNHLIWMTRNNPKRHHHLHCARRCSQVVDLHDAGARPVLRGCSVAIDDGRSQHVLSFSPADGDTETSRRQYHRGRNKLETNRRCRQGRSTAQHQVSRTEFLCEVCIQNR